MIKILIPLLSLAIGYYFQWQANRLKHKRWQAENSYKLGRLYKQINRYESIAKMIYFIALFITCATFLF
jgi:membrane protein required for beta-lactamase induction